MKRIFTLIFSSLLILLFSFKPLVGLEDVIAALNTGNATELAKYVDDNIEINLPDKGDTYSRTQAVMILRDFFSNNGVKSFEVKHKGNNGASEFCIGVLNTRSGNYRTTVYMVNKNGKNWCGK